MPSIPLIKGLDYAFEFSNRDYYFHTDTINTSNPYQEYDVLLSDIGSKVRNEKVIPKSTVVKRK
jgi:hypothetical protein